MRTPKEMYRDLQGLLKELQSTADDQTLDMAERVQAGSVLWTVHQEAKDALSTLKADLREHARAKLNGEPGTVKMDGGDYAWAKVLLPDNGLRVREGADPSCLKGLLGTDWHDVFDEVTSYKVRKEASATIQVLQPEDRAKLLEHIEEFEHTARVSLKWTE